MNLQEMQQDHAYLNSTTHKPEPFVDFPFDEIDRGNPLVAELTEATYAQLGSALIVMLQWMWRSPGGKRRTIKSAQLRFAALSCLVRPDLFDSRSLKSIAEQFGVSKASLSKCCTQFSDEFGVHFRRSRREESREKMRVAHLKAEPQHSRKS